MLKRDGSWNIGGDIEINGLKYGFSNFIHSFRLEC